MAQRTFRGQAETLIVVTLITALVWLYAEGESVRQYTNEPVTLRFVSLDHDDVRIEPAERSVLITYDASSVQAQEFRSRLVNGVVEIPVSDLSDDGSPTQRLIAKDELNAALLDDLGIVADSVDPPTIDVTVQRMAEVALPIEVITPAVKLAAPPNVTPDALVLLLPAALADEPNGLRLRARLDLVDLAGMAVNQPITLDVPLELPEELSGLGVKLPRPSVPINLTISQLTEQITLKTVPIRLVAAPRTLKTYTIDLPDDQQVLTDVVLSGPADAMAQIQEERFPVWAEIHVTADDLERQLQPEAQPLIVQLHIPPGVTLDSTVPAVPLIVQRLE